MTIHEIAHTLPNGFHDAFLRGFTVDYLRRVAVFDIEALTGVPDGENHVARESYRRLRLTLKGLLICAVHTPNQEALEDVVNGHGIDLMDSKHTFDTSPFRDEPLPDGALRGTFAFTQEWNSYIHFAAMNAQTEWVSEPRLIYSFDAAPVLPHNAFTSPDLLAP